jgi:hypothetical protein
MPYDYTSPCRTLIIARMGNGTQRSVRIPYTGYAMDTHAKRWLGKGAQYVVVCVYSHSTGRLVSERRYQASEGERT